MRFKTHGNKADHVLITVKNAEASVTIKKGAPIFADPASSAAGGAGLEVKSAELLADVNQPFFFGLAAAEIAPGDPGEAVVFGFYDSARVMLRTRSATDADWASVEAHSIGEGLDFVTLAGVQAVSKMGTIGPTNVMPALVLAQTYSSLASIAGTDYTATFTRSDTNLRAMVRTL